MKIFLLALLCVTWLIISDVQASPLECNNFELSKNNNGYTIKENGLEISIVAYKSEKLISVNSHLDLQFGKSLLNPVKFEILLKCILNEIDHSSASDLTGAIFDLTPTFFICRSLDYYLNNESDDIVDIKAPKSALDKSHNVIEFSKQAELFVEIERALNSFGYSVKETNDNWLEFTRLISISEYITNYETPHGLCSLDENAISTLISNYSDKNIPMRVGKVYFSIERTFNSGEKVSCKNNFLGQSATKCNQEEAH